MKRNALFAALSICTLFAVAPQGGSAAEQPRVRLQTNMGVMIIELNHDKAPKTVDNFLRYVREGHYDGTIFHRVIPNFMIQGGGFSADYKQKAVHEPIANEADNGLVNSRGTVAMARTSDPDSATAQFFINIVDNDFLNHTSPTPRGWGYAVFGTVVEGMDIADKIAKTPTGAAGPFSKDAPRQAVIIEKATIVAESGAHKP
jgi:peptidyl-prolyl cis-trans isomerase B (cyclophilin B)